MFIVTLKFNENRAQAPHLMDGHMAWLKRGFDEGVFLLAGSLPSSQGGAVLAHNTELEDLQARVGDDPFVSENVVSADILEFTPAKSDERLSFLLA